MVDGNKLGDVGFKYIGTPYKQMDCQAFVEQCLRDCGCKKDLPGSNAWYREVMNNGWVGSPEDCVKQLGCVPKGAFLFILEQDGKEPPKYKGDGIGNASHIGLVTMPRGKGAIHSSASRGCVAESDFKGKTIKNGGWNRVGLWDQVSYDYGGDEPIPAPTPEPEPEPETETAIVIAEKGKNVNLRKSPSINAKLIDKVPLGETVTVLVQGQDWCQIKWQNKIGWMMTRFLLFEDETPVSDDYTVVITGLTKEQAELLCVEYGDNASISVG